MKKAVIILLIVGGVLTVFGLALGGVTVALIHGDFKALETQETVNGTQTVEKYYTSVSVKTGSTNVRILPSADGETKVEYTVERSYNVDITVSDGTLTVSVVKNPKSWLDSFGFSFTREEIRLYLPENVCETLIVEVGSADVKVEKDLTFSEASCKTESGSAVFDAVVTGQLTVSCESGDVYVGADAGKVTLNTSSGEIFVKNAVFGETDATSSSGTVKCKDCLFASLSVNTSSGGATLDGCTVGTLTVKSSSGTVRFDGLTLTENGTVQTSSGSVKGNVCGNTAVTGTSSSGNVSVPVGGDAENVLSVKTSSGSIRIDRR